MGAKLIFVILALIFFGIAFFKKLPEFDWIAGGFFWVVCAVLLPL